MAGHGSQKALPEWLHTRQTKGTNVSQEFAGSCSMTNDLVRRLGLVRELEGHGGCVNCIQWNSNGRLLASGSDDKTVIVWDGLVGKRLAKVETPHEGNIFSVVWLPGGEDQMVATGAGDCRVCVLNVETGAALRSVSGHSGRVKRLTTAADNPGVVWSGGEDGVVRQWDLRERWSQDSANVVVNLLQQAGRGAEVKCVAVCPGRSELLAVGANDPYVRVFDRRMVTPSRLEPAAAPPSESGAVAYFVPGHLPGAEAAFHRKLRPLTSTYITYNKDGSELLCNLGGEQIYLYDKFALYSTAVPLNMAVINDCDTKDCGPASNGYSTGLLKNGHSKAAFKPLPADVESLKLSANTEFESQDFTKAVALYNQAIALYQAPHPILCGNRAAALMKRKWDGDTYAALRDCLTALSLDPGHIKAHLRLAQCLTDLEWLSEADTCLDNFKLKHPEHMKSAACTQLERDLNTAKEKSASAKTGATSSTAPAAPTPVLSQYSAASFLRSDDADGDEVMDSDDDSDETTDETPAVNASHPGGISSRLGHISSDHSKQETAGRLKARDYSARFLGACNTTTDIKEANFLGRNGQFIMAGSDDGKFFIWDRKTTNIVRVLMGDEAIVNCLQGHPTAPILATSGIDPVVRIWQPRPEDGEENTRVVEDLEAAASSNQRRMNADPFETILLNMGYRMNVDEEAGDANEGAVQCRPS